MEGERDERDREGKGRKQGKRDRERERRKAKREKEKERRKKKTNFLIQILVHLMFLKCLQKRYIPLSSSVNTAAQVGFF